jgi:hypothetical protein
MTHDVAIHSIQRFHDAGLRKRFLNPLAKRVRVTKPQDHRSVLVLLKRIGNVDEDFILQRLHTDRLLCFHRVHSASATDHDFTEDGCVLESCSARAFA